MSVRFHSNRSPLPQAAEGLLAGTLDYPGADVATTGQPGPLYPTGIASNRGRAGSIASQGWPRPA